MAREEREKKQRMQFLSRGEKGEQEQRGAMKKPMQSWSDKRDSMRDRRQGGRHFARSTISRLNIAREDSKTTLRVSQLLKVPRRDRPGMLQPCSDRHWTARKIADRVLLSLRSPRDFDRPASLSIGLLSSSFIRLYELSATLSNSFPSRNFSSTLDYNVQSIIYFLILGNQRLFYFKII